MQGKYRIYISYIITMLIGVFLFVMFIFFIEKRSNIEKIASITPLQPLPNLNQDLEEPIKMIDNVEAIDTKEEKNIYKIIVDKINIREKPSVESKIIKKYINGNNIEIININGNWGELKSGGFAYMELLEKNDDKDAKLASDSGIMAYKIKVNNLNIREKPSVESKILKRMSINQQIFIENIEGKWGKIDGGGFAYMELLEKE